MKAGKLKHEAKFLHFIIGVLTYYMKSSYISLGRFQYETERWHLASVDLFIQIVPISFCELSEVSMHLLVRM